MAETGGDEPTSRFSKPDIWAIVENQLVDGVPEETGRTLRRLLAAGYGRDEAIDKIGTVVVEELFDVLHTLQPFDERRFTAKLRALK
jgi:dihydropteroate synthase